MGHVLNNMIIQYVCNLNYMPLCLECVYDLEGYYDVPERKNFPFHSISRSSKRFGIRLREN